MAEEAESRADGCRSCGGGVEVAVDGGAEEDDAEGTSAESGGAEVRDGADGV